MCPQPLKKEKKCKDGEDEKRAKWVKEEIEEIKREDLKETIPSLLSKEILEFGTTLRSWKAPPDTGAGTILNPPILYEL